MTSGTATECDSQPQIKQQANLLQRMIGNLSSSATRYNAKHVQQQLRAGSHCFGFAIHEIHHTHTYTYIKSVKYWKILVHATKLIKFVTNNCKRRALHSMGGLRLL